MGARSRLVVVTLLTVLLAGSLAAQEPRDAAEIRLGLERARVLGSVLYVGAHPDDENTALLAYLAKGRKVRAAYLSVTRGDGGQNLIGTEQGEALAVIRTEELLAARKIDGAEQFFTRARDFGYSKTAEETLRIWGHDGVLADIVWVIRSFRPDVIISRFPENGDGGHGHHTASAILTREAFAAAADPTRFPEQLTLVRPWQARRLLWNAWRRPGEAPPADAPHEVLVDLGTFDPLLGRSYAEIASLARTMHKSQGFGSTPRRGPLPNYFRLVAGEPAANDILDGVDLTWRRVRGGEVVDAVLARAVASFDDNDPAASVPTIAEALAAIDGLAGDPWLEVKRRELADLVRSCAGLWLDVTAAQPASVPGGVVKLTLTAINRSPAPLELVRVALPFDTVSPPIRGPLPYNTPVNAEVNVALPEDLPVTQPFWLANRYAQGSWTVPEQRLVGTPHGPPALAADFVIGVAGREVAFKVGAVHRWTDPVEGERVRELAIVPAVTVDLEAPVVFLSGGEPRPVRATVQAHSAVSGLALRAACSGGFRIEPERVEVTLGAGEESSLVWTVTPPTQEGSGELRLLVGDGAEQARGMRVVEHSHIPPQTLLPAARVRLVRVDVTRPVTRIGYIMGPGDEIPEVLRQLGFEVTLLGDEELALADLSLYGAIVVGVRAFNTRARLAELEDRLFAYVAAGGTLVVQYATSRETVTDRLGPYPFRLSRDRVTDEAAAVSFLDPQHPLFSTPHRITAADFDGWVQERGLYFADQWDAAYTPLLAMADPGEKPSRGALLFARHGKGSYIYTGLAFFRQLPAGVPGAVRLFVNLVAGGKNVG